MKKIIYGGIGFIAGVAVMSVSTAMLLERDYPEVFNDMHQRYGRRKKR